jgi:hypothetical protein
MSASYPPAAVICTVSCVNSNPFLLPPLHQSQDLFPGSPRRRPQVVFSKYQKIQVDDQQRYLVKNQLATSHTTS